MREILSMTKQQTFDLAGARLLALRISMFQFQKLPYERLKSRNLREDLHGAGVIPKGYISYCCSQKAPFRKPGSLDQSLMEMLELGELKMLRPGSIQKSKGIDINAKATLYMVGDKFAANYQGQLDHIMSKNFQPEVPVNYPVARLRLENIASS